MPSNETASGMYEGRRQLAAILCADIVGYSRLIGSDEEGTHERFKRYRREVIHPTIIEHHGRIFSNTGDGFLAIFASPLEAVRCAIVIQQNIAARNGLLPKNQWMQYRIGVNLGDVVVDPTGVYGDAVNVAVRLEQMAKPGGICVSGGIYEQVKNKLVCGYLSLGDEKLTGITDPVSVYRILPDPNSVARVRRARNLQIEIALMLLATVSVGGWYVWRSMLPPDWMPSLSLLPLETKQTVQAPALAPPAATTVVSVSPPQAAAASPADPAPVQRTEMPAPSPPAAAPPTAQKVPEPVTVASVPKHEPVTSPMSSGDEGEASAATNVAALPSPSVSSRPTPTVAVFRDCPQCPEMINLPGGMFQMGSDDDPTEQPVRQVTVAPLALGRFPVTIGEWNECVAAQACSYRPEGDPDLPVHNVSWDDAQDYIGWLSRITGQPYRLPTEAEWEFAARAGTTTTYWWGGQLVAGMANCKGCGGPYESQRPSRVGSFPANAYGLHGMGGGVSQWVADCWFKNHEGAPRDSSARSLPNCREHVLRGGSWRHGPGYASVSSREKYDTGVRYIAHGFRVARSPKPEAGGVSGVR